MATNSDPVFLDTAYINALINTRDQWHSSAILWQERLDREQSRIVTTELVLVEIADSLSSVRFRLSAAQVIRVLQSSPLVEIVPASSHLIDTALQLYEQRQDKDWGLTDCASFVVMTNRNLTAALTTDDLFRQAGFRPLLLSSDSD